MIDKTETKQLHWQEVAALIANTFGCLVMESPRQLRIGDVVNDLNVRATTDENSDQPFIVMGQATRADWERQCRFYGWQNFTDSHEDAFYYFIETD